MNNPLISVIIPTYNMRESLKDLLLSLESQTEKNFEVIIVENGSHKEGQEFLESITSNLKLNLKIVPSVENLGPGKGRNLGATIAKGEILAFTDDDCIVETNWISVIKNTFATKQNNKVIFGGVNSEIKPFYPFIHAFDFNGQVFGSGNCAFLHSFFKEIGGFDEFVNYWAEDYEIGAKSELNNQTPLYIEEMMIDHPPKLWRYQLRSGVYQFMHLNIHYYLTRIKGYQYKDELYKDVFKKAFLKIIIISVIFLLPLSICINILLVFSFFSFFAIKKVIKLQSLKRNYPFKESIPLWNYGYFILTSWLVDILNLFVMVSYYLYRRFKKLERE